MSRVKIVTLSGLLIVTLIAVGVFVFRVAPKGSSEVTASPNWMFSHTSASGTFTDNHDGTYLLTLNGADRDVTAFTDRPNRETAIIPIVALANRWSQLFKDAPPNAVLVEHDSSGEADSIVVELTTMAVRGTTATFTARILTSQQRPLSLSNIGGTPYSTPPARFSEVSLFIDDVSRDASAAAGLTSFTPYNPYA